MAKKGRNGHWRREGTKKEQCAHRLTHWLFHVDFSPCEQKVRGVPVIQLETAVGSAMACADRPGVVCVPRSRFLVCRAAIRIYHAMTHSKLDSKYHVAAASLRLTRYSGASCAKACPRFLLLSDGGGARYAAREGGLRHARRPVVTVLAEREFRPDDEPAPQLPCRSPRQPRPQHTNGQLATM